ncbi:MAG: hypothetical protein H0U99_04375, partial [Chthoniobacterales bacterium]|nr:hypothetical protein [Chthoniobacterales bacterium]
TYLDLAVTLVFIFLAVVVLLRMRASYGIYVTASLFFVTAWGLPLSIGRFGLVIFPLVMALALLGRNEHFHRSYLIVSTGLAAFFMLVFSQWGWVA